MAEGVEFDIKAVDEFSRVLKEFDRRVANTGLEVDKVRMKVGKHSVYMKRQRREYRRAGRASDRYRRSLYDVGLASTNTGWKLNKMTMGLKSSRFHGSALAAVLASAVVVGLYATARALKSVTKEFAKYEMSIAKAAMRQEDFVGSTEKFRSAAIRAGAASIFSAGEAAKALEKLSAAGLTANQSMAMLQDTLSLATIADMSTDQAAEVATGIMAAFQLPVDQLGSVNDILAYTATKTKTSVGEIGTAMEYVGTVAGQFELDIREVSAALGMMAQSNIKGEKAGTALRGMLMKLANPSKEAAALLKEIGIKVWDKLPDGTRKFKSLVDIVRQFKDAGVGAANTLEVFMQRAGPGFAAILGQGPDKLEEFTKKLEEAEGAAKEMEDRMLGTFSGQMQLLGGAFETVKILAGEFVAAGLRPVVEWLYNLMNASLETDSSFQRFMRFVAKEASEIFMFLGDIVYVFGILPLHALIETYYDTKIGLLGLSMTFNRLDMAIRALMPTIKFVRRQLTSFFEGMGRTLLYGMKSVGSAISGVLVGAVERSLKYLADQVRGTSEFVFKHLGGKAASHFKHLANALDGMGESTERWRKAEERATDRANKMSKEKAKEMREEFSANHAAFKQELKEINSAQMAIERDMIREINESTANKAEITKKLYGLRAIADQMGKDIARGLDEMIEKSEKGLLKAEALQKMLDKLKDDQTHYEVPDSGSGSGGRSRPDGYYIFMEASLREQDKLMSVLLENHAKRTDLASKEMGIHERRLEEYKLEIELAERMQEISEENHGYVIERALAEIEGNDALTDSEKELHKLAVERRRLAQKEMSSRDKEIGLMRLANEEEKLRLQIIRDQRKEREELLDSYTANAIEGFSGFGEGSGRIAGEVGGEAIARNQREIDSLEASRGLGGNSEAMQYQIDALQAENDQIRENIELHQKRVDAIEKSSLAMLEMAGSINKVGEFGLDTAEGANAMVQAFSSVDSIGKGFMDAIGVGAKKQAKILAAFNIAMAAYMTALAIGNPALAGQYGTAAAKHLFAAGKFGVMAAVGGGGVAGGGGSPVRMAAPVVPDDRGKEDLARLIGEELRRNDRQRMDKALIIDLRNAVIAGESPEAARILGNLVRPELDIPGI